MSDFLDSALDYCPCGFPCALFRRFAGFVQKLNVRDQDGRVRPVHVHVDLLTQSGSLNGHPMTAARITDELTYRSYAYNRTYGVTPEHWARAFPRADVEAMERRYQEERT